MLAIVLLFSTVDLLVVEEATVPCKSLGTLVARYLFEHFTEKCVKGLNQ